MSVVAENNLAQSEAFEKNEVGAENEEDDRLVGLIIPPPELRHIIETTATFVAKNGQSFEERIRKDNPDKKKFDFLLAESPYNPYYRNKIKEIILKLEKPDDPVQELNSEIKALTSAGDPKDKVTNKADAETPAVAPELVKTIDSEFLIDPPTLKSEDVMTLKLTAQYAAVNGRSFLIELSEREFKNSTFDFLKPQHSHFAYFTKLIEQYVKILNPDDSTLANIHKDNEFESNVLKKVQSRVSWMHFNAKQKANIKESDERDRIAYNQIDWNEFTIVETIDYKEGEEGIFMPPCQPNQIGMRNLMQERMLLEAAKQEEEIKIQNKESNNPIEEPIHNEITDAQPNLHDGQIGPGLEEMKIPPRDNSISQPQIHGEKVIEANYDPKSKSALNQSSSQSLISPFTGENISATNVQQHMKYILESKKDRNAPGGDMRDSVYASGDEIARNLKKLHNERLDIFQVGVDEGKKKFMPPQFTPTSNTESANFQDMMPMYGQLPSNMNAAPIPMPPIPGPPQIPPPNQPVPSEQPMPSPPITHNTNLPPSSFAPLQPAQAPFVASFDNQFVMPGFAPSQPNAKKFKSDKNVMPEVEFLNQYGNDPLPYFIVVPNLPNNNNWDLRGQTLEIAFALDQPLSKLKTEISRLTNFPVSKQKLQFDNTFLKDQETLALHNVNPKSFINVLLKERGGKKK